MDKIIKMKPSQDIFDCCLKIHKTLGPGLLESVYQNCLGYELEKIGYAVEKEVTLPIKYESLNFEHGFRADLIVNDKIIIEIKSVNSIAAAHKAQILTYIKVANYPLGLLINFGEPLIKNGFHRFANGNEANDL